MSASRERKSNKQKEGKRKRTGIEGRKGRELEPVGMFQAVAGGGLRVLDRKPGNLRYDRSLASPLGAEDETQLALLEVWNERRRGEARGS